MSEKKGRKFDRNRVGCKRYKAESRREKHLMRDLRYHVRHNENDKLAANTLKSWEMGGIVSRQKLDRGQKVYVK